MVRVLALEVFGSNLVLDCKKARGSCVKPWSALVEKSLTGGMERAKGIEPSCAVWKTAVLPLNYARNSRRNHRGRRFKGQSIADWGLLIDVMREFRIFSHG